MAINTAGQTLAQSQANGVLLFANGSDTYDGTSITAADYTKVTVGFKPRYVCFINVTDRIRVEWWEGMADDTCIKTAANGTVTLETTNKGITVAADSFQVSQNATLAVIAASKVIRWHVLG
jgi:hypothetical protein